jgi:NAD(P)H-dependent FMN reductase
MTTIVGISGSLRRGSFNSMLLRAAVELMPKAAALEIGSLREIPLYDGDVENATGVPPAAQALKERIVNADGLLIVTPEYNNSIPGVLKNAIDWLTRPPADIPRVFANRPLAMMGATPGKSGTMLAQTAWLPIWRTLGVQFWPGPRMLISNAAHLFDQSGRLVDESVRARLQKFMADFVDFIRK